MGFLTDAQFTALYRANLTAFIEALASWRAGHIHLTGDYIEACARAAFNKPDLQLTRAQRSVFTGHPMVRTLLYRVARVPVEAERRTKRSRKRVRSAARTRL